MTKNLYLEIINCHSPIDARNILLKLNGKINWKPLGGRINNLSTVNLGSDPAAGVIERITNSMDAVIESSLNGHDAENRNPREIVEELFSIKEGRLKSIKDFKKQNELTKKIQVTVLDSGNTNRPTLEIRDHGIGVDAKDFSNTVLSLNANNKIKKQHLLGAFGQGGATSFSYNDITLIMSKKNKKGIDVVSWTFVRINPGNQMDKHGWYEYCIDKETGLPFVIEDTNNLFAPGTLIRHLMMDLGKYKGRITTPTNSLWFLCHNYLFDPVLPFTIADKRKDRNESRTVSGNHRLLSKSENLEHYKEIPITFKNGKLKIFYWVLKHDGEKAQNRIKHYTLTSQPIIITLNGQKQGYFSNKLIKEDLNLSFLEKYIIIQIECDLIDNDSKRQLFSTTREKLRDTSIYDDLKKVLIETLSEEDELKKLDFDRRRIYFSRKNENLSDYTRKNITSKITSYINNGSSNSKNATIFNGEIINADKINIKTPSTFLEILNEKVIKASPGKMFSVKFKTDSDPDRFYDPECFYAEFIDSAFGYFTGSVRAKDGYGIAYFKLSENINSDASSKLILKLKNEQYDVLTDDVTVEVNIKEKGDKPKLEKVINVEYIYANDPYYIQNNFNKNTVGDLVVNENEITIFVSAENLNFEKLIAKAQKINEDAVVTMRSKYLEQTSLFIYMILSRNTQVEQQNRSLLEKMVESVCHLLNDHFDLIISDTKNKYEAKMAKN